MLGMKPPNFEIDHKCLTCRIHFAWENRRWQETLVNSKTHKPTQKTGGREPAALAEPVCSGGKRAGGSTSKASVGCGRSSRGSDSTAGGSLRRGSLGHQGCGGHQSTGRASRPARPALGLCSSRSFSSLHATPLAAAPFMRSSRSLSRLDQRSTRDDSEHAVPVKKGHTTEKKAVNSVQLSSSEERSRDNKDQCHGDNAEKMKASKSCKQPQSSSSLVSNSECHHHCNKVKKPARDGGNTLSAMTSGMRRNWVQVVLKNVRPSATPDVTNSLSEQHPDPPSTEGLNLPEQPNSFLQEYETSDCAEESLRQQAGRELKLQPEREPSPAGGPASSTISSSHLPPAISPSTSSALSPIGAQQQAEEGDAASCHQCDGSIPTAMLPNDECTDEHLNVRSEAEPVEAGEMQQVSPSIRCECVTVEEKPPCEQQTGQLVKELEQTQKELSRLQQLNRNLQDELQREREGPSRISVHPQSDRLSNSSSSPGQALALQQLQKMNHDLRSELEARKASQEEAREAELRQRADLLAQQAQLLVTGDATALAQAKLEQDRRRFHEQQMELEHRVASLKSQLSVSKEQRKEAESLLAQLQQELQGYHSVRQEADRLQKGLHEVTAQLLANEEAQAQKEARLQKHLMLLQASQDRERRSLAASLTQAEQHSQDLQERLDRAEQQVGSLNQTQNWTWEIEKAQEQLQEELARTVSAMQKLQEEREQLNCRCEELHNQLSEADVEVSRLKSRLKTDETHYYNLEHSYERVCEELQVALGKVQQKERDTQDMRKGYERLLNQKEQELSEVLLKMEVLGNSLEETEVKLNEVQKVCTCSSSSSEPAQQQTTNILTLNDSRPKATDCDRLPNGSFAIEHVTTHSRSTDPSHHSAVAAGADPDRVISVIQMLETKLYVTEEKLRDIMQRLEEHHSHVSCQDPQLCSQLTRSQATAQHLSLRLHSQAKQSQRFAQEAENRCRMLVGRFQVALNITQACREKLQATPINITDLEKQLVSVAACLQQGEKDAERQQHESRNASKGEDKILNDETLAGVESNVSAKSKLTNALPSDDVMGNVGKWLMREIFVVEKMVSALQSQHGIGQLSLVPREEEEGVTSRYRRIISQRIALRTEKRTQSGRETHVISEPLERVISRVCAEAELIYAALKFQQQYESVPPVNKQQAEHQRVELADVNPPELAPYEEQVQVEDGGVDGAAKPGEKDECDVKRPEAEKDWLEGLISRLHKRAKCLHQLCQEICDGDGVVECSMDDDWENSSVADVSWMQEQAMLTYLSDRLLLDSEQELRQSEALQDKLQALCKEQDVTLKDEQKAFNRTLCQLQEDNSVLRGELERAEQKIISVEMGNQRLLEDIRKIESYHEERMKRLETEFHGKIRELQQIHEGEMKHLHGYYTQSACADRTSPLPDQATMERKTKEELEKRMTGGDAVAMRAAHQRDLEKLQASCDEGFTAMEEMHRQVIADLQRQHQQEVAALLKEKDQLLQEETAATMAAIVAMRRAHKQELEKRRQSQHIKDSVDISHEKEIQLLHKELEVLSAQHAQKCLENSQLVQQLQGERQPWTQYQKENQELKKKQDKLYAKNKLKALYTNIQDDPYHDANELCEDFKFAPGQSLEDTVTNTSNAAFLKRTEKSSLTRLIRGVRSKSLKEGLSVQERMKLFESF